MNNNLNIVHLISIVLPIHNGERFLSETINSILNQTYNNFELILVENCSSDSSLEIVRSYKDKRIKLVFERRCGIPFAYNRGFIEATGDFIVVHDQDDISTPNRLESQLQFLINNNLDLCGSGFDIVDEKGQLIKTLIPPTNQVQINEKLFYDFFAIFNPTLIIKKKTLVSLNYFNTNITIGADYDFLFRALSKYKMGNNPSILLKYRYHKSSSSKRYIDIGNKLNKTISLKYYELLKSQLWDKHLTKARIYFYYNDFAKSLWCLCISIYHNGFTGKNFKFFLKLFLFTPYIKYMRKKGVFFNKKFNRFVKLIKH